MMNATKSRKPPHPRPVIPLFWGVCSRAPRYFSADHHRTNLFVVGDFIVVDVGTDLRFDTSMVLKEDYDYTAQHLQRCVESTECAHGRRACSCAGRR